MRRPLLSLIYRIYTLPSAAGELVESYRKARRCTLGAGARLYSQSRINNPQAPSDIVIGSETRLLGRLETMGHGGHIQISTHCFIGENTNIWSASSINIGNRVLISHDVNIHDSDSHSLSATLRHEHFKAIFSSGHPNALPDVHSRPINICDDAWIGFGATVLKGVTIGRGAVVGARTVVTKDVAPFTVVVGNPARVVGESRA
jgi:acetyltransferase-like isoleucine patch superfamily enzyme